VNSRTRRETPLLEAFKRLAPCHHACLIFESQAEQLAAVIPFLQTGLERGETCIYLMEDERAGAVVEALRAGGIDVDSALQSGAVTIVHRPISPVEYPAGGKTGTGNQLPTAQLAPVPVLRGLHTDWMIEFLQAAVGAASAAGLPALRMTGEVVWQPGDESWMRRLMEHESRLNAFLAEHNCSAMCQYDRRQFPPKVILEVIRRHPIVIYRDTVRENHYYVPPEEFLEPVQPAREVERLLANIRDREQVGEALRQTRDDLETGVQKRTGELERANRALQAAGAESMRAMEALAASEQRYRHIFDNVNDVIFMTDLQGNITSVNKAVERSTGYSLAEVSQWNISQIVAPQSLDLAHEMVQAKLGGIERTTYELAVNTRDGRTLQFEVSSRLQFREGQPVGVLGIARDVTERRRAEQALRESEAALHRNREELRALTAALLTAQEEERKRVSRELHDGLNQKLAVLAMDVEALEQRLPLSPDPMQAGLRSLRTRVVELSDEIRRMAYQLHPSVLEHLGLTVALQSYCAEFSKREGIKVRFTDRNVPEPLPQDVALCLYRVAQEGLRNVAKHSASRRATVTLQGKNDAVQLSITDFGVGFDPQSVKGKGGLGFISMEERVRLVQGSLSVKSRAGHGTRIEVRIPLPEQTARRMKLKTLPPA
jgi:PAS domain S-box-containing protein